MAEEVKTKLVRVGQAEDLATFAKRVGVDVKKVLELNEVRMREHASARGFDHTFQRTTADKDGKLSTSVDYHVFPGEELVVPADSGNGGKKNGGTTSGTTSGGGSAGGGSTEG